MLRTRGVSLVLHPVTAYQVSCVIAEYVTDIGAEGGIVLAGTGTEYPQYVLFQRDAE
jgi:hypothetical protein